MLLTPPLEALDCKLVVLLRVGEFRIGLLFKLPLGSGKGGKAECHEYVDKTGREREEEGGGVRFLPTNWTAVVLP